MNKCSHSSVIKIRKKENNITHFQDSQRILVKFFSQKKLLKDPSNHQFCLKLLYWYSFEKNEDMHVEQIVGHMSFPCLWMN